MPAPIGARERHTQDRVLHLFQHSLGYEYLGDWKDRPDNRPIETDFLTRFLQNQGYSSALIARALHELHRAAGDSTQPLYNVNRAVYGLLRYGVKVKAESIHNLLNKLADTLGAETAIGKPDFTGPAESV